MRFHQPIGILLLWLPTAWALWIANKGSPPFPLLLLFFFGTIVMRAAGCIMNDIADRHIDIHVKRTHKRPLVSGEVSLVAAFGLFFALFVCALIILIQLPRVCFYYAILAIFITVLYPFCKRLIKGPQFVLGVAFSMGIPMVFAAAHQLFPKTMFYLLMINFLWIIVYDTQYAMVDRDDDLRIGVQSTAILFASYDRLIIGILQIVFHALWLPLAIELDYSLPYFAGWLIAALILIGQQRLIAGRDRQGCLQAFASNSWYGLVMWFAIMTNGYYT
jgi:4-hydroxybenzoate polyprenyltransferase